MSDETVIVGHGHDLHRRPAAGEGRDRRGGDRRGAGRRRRPHAHLRRRRPLRRRRRARARDRAPDPRQPAGRRKTAPWEVAARRASRCSTRRSCTASSRPTCASRSTSAKSSRASSTAASSTSSRPATARRWSPGSRASGLPGRHRRQQRHPVHRKRAQGRALHRAVRQAPDPAGVPAEHHRLHGRPGVREPRHRQATAPRWSWRSRTPRCRSSRSSSAASSARATTACAAAPTRRASCGCGRTRGSASWAASRPRACCSRCGCDALAREGGDMTAGRARRVHRADARDVRARRHAVLLDRAAVGRRHHRPASTRAWCWRSACRRRSSADPGHAVRRVPDVAASKVGCSRRSWSRTGARSRCG